jgi:hypothetical protein
MKLIIEGILAAIGSARNAPVAPNKAPPIKTATKLIAGDKFRTL